uniref:U2A'/phosphoprotein 32 family A C-terminal domain-containing protein n=1 Tax=Oryza glumipatula TaxID=40148 RepID=A0A0D9Z390_9ORYZ
MTKISCFSALLAGKRKLSKVTSKIGYGKKSGGNEFQKVKPVEFMEGTDTVDIGKGGGDIVLACDTKVVAFNAAELACEGRDKDDDMVSVKRDTSDVDLVAGGDADSSGYNSDAADKDASSAAAAPDASEPGVGLMVPAMASRLERSCSNIETARRGSKAFELPVKSLSYGDLMALPAGGSATATPVGAPDDSPAASVKTTCSADHVMLKKCSSSQVLPSRSRKLWWRLLLRSHRNLHRPAATVPAAVPSAEQRHDGYASDTLDAGAATADVKNKGIAVGHEPIPNQWMAFSSEATSLDRVSAWVNSLVDNPFKANEECIVEHDDDDDDTARPHCTEIGEPSSFGGKFPAQARRRMAGEAIKANSIIQTLTTSSSVAHISGMGLTVIPVISPFSSLRAISVIEGLRELTRLRVLNLSYNKISRIGHGLSNCGAIRELYLAGNKISDVEGLHRLLKLAVVDLSFNKITTTKALGQLVANYSSLRALNLVGNPVQTNIGDDALRKAASGLLSRLEYLNKQPVRPQRAREAAKDSVAKAALGNGGWSSRRRPTPSSRRLSQSPGSSVKNRGRDNGSGSHRGSRSRSKSRPHQGFSLARK